MLLPDHSKNVHRKNSCLQRNNSLSHERNQFRRQSLQYCSPLGQRLGDGTYLIFLGGWSINTKVMQIQVSQIEDLLTYNFSSYKFYLLATFIIKPFVHFPPLWGDLHQRLTATERYTRSSRVRKIFSPHVHYFITCEWLKKVNLPPEIKLLGIINQNCASRSTDELFIKIKLKVTLASRKLTRLIKNTTSYSPQIMLCAAKAVVLFSLALERKVTF